jgi:hypothetical protein
LTVFNDLTTDELAAVLKVCPKSIERWARTGRIPGKKVSLYQYGQHTGGFRRWMFCLPEVMKALSSRATPPDTANPTD